MKRLLALIPLIFCLWGTAPADAACAGGTCFWIGSVNTLWGTSGNWATTSGGGSCACTPGSGDNITLDGNSGSGSSNVSTTFTIGNLDTTGFTGTLTGSSAVQVNGNTFKLAAGTTFTNTSTWTFASTSGTTAITTAGKTLANITLNGVGGTFQLQDAMTISASGTLTLTNGVFDANNQNLSIGNFSSNNSNTRTLTMGSGTWTITGTTGTVWNLGTTTGLTFNVNTSTLAFSATTTSARTLTMGALTYNVVTFGANTSGGVIAHAGPNTFATLNISAPNFIQFTTATTLTITNAFTWTGTSGNEIFIQSNSTSAQTTISSANNGSCAWCAVRGMAFTGGGTFTASNSFDLLQNSGITITAPSTSGGGPNIIGGWLSKRALSPAANDNTPMWLDTAA